MRGRAARAALCLLLAVAIYCDSAGAATAAAAAADTTDSAATRPLLPDASGAAQPWPTRNQPARRPHRLLLDDEQSALTDGPPGSGSSGEADAGGGAWAPAALVPDDTAAAAEAAVPPVPSGGSSSTIIWDVAFVDQKCSMMHHALLVGPTLVEAEANPQPSVIHCCQSCFAKANCTAWVYCHEEGGCTAIDAWANATSDGDGDAIGGGSHAGSTLAAAGGEAPLLRQLSAPYQGCRLLSIPFFKLRKDSVHIAVKGQDLKFVSGTPVTIFLPSVPGYSVRPGTDTAAGLGYKCTESLLLHSCVLQGSAEELAAKCDSDPLCKAFVYLPNGVDTLSEPIGIFKGGEDIQSIAVSLLAPNPATALYIKSSVQTTTSSGGGGDRDGSAADTDSSALFDGRGAAGTSCGGGGGARTSRVLWIVLPTLLAAALLMVTAVAVYATAVLRQQAREQHQAADAAAAAGAAAAAAGARSKPPSEGPPASAPPSDAARPFSVVVQLVKPSPPGSGSSTASGGSGGSGRASGCVSCPQCGVALGIACRRHHPQPQPQPAGGAHSSGSSGQNGGGGALSSLSPGVRT